MKPTSTSEKLLFYYVPSTREELKELNEVSFHWNYFIGFKLRRGLITWLMALILLPGYILEMWCTPSPQ